MRELLKNPRVSLPPSLSSPFQNFCISSYDASFTLMGSWMRVEGLSSGSPEEGHKSCSHEKAVEMRTKKRRAKEEREQGRRWKYIYVYASFVRVRFIAVASPSEATKKETARRESNPLKHNSCKYWYRTYLSVYIYAHTVRAREELSIFLRTSQRTFFPVALPLACYDLPDLIRYCHANLAARIRAARDFSNATCSAIARVHVCEEDLRHFVVLHFSSFSRGVD